MIPFVKLLNSLIDGSIKAIGQDTLTFKVMSDRRRKLGFDLSRPLGTERRAWAETSEQVFAGL